MEYAALVTWLFTAVFGFVMLATWVSHGGARAGAGQASHFRPPVVFGHFLLAVAGLVVWLVYLVNDSSVLAWVAFVDLVVVALLGETLVFRWSKDRRAATATGTGAATAPANGAAGRDGTGLGDTLTGRAATRPAAGGLAEQRFPVPVVAAHGLFAVATVVLVFLTALGVGGS